MGVMCVKVYKRVLWAVLLQDLELEDAHFVHTSIFKGMCAYVEHALLAVRTRLTYVEHALFAVRARLTYVEHALLAVRT